MRKTALALIALGLVVAMTASANVRISQIYGANGNTYKCDYVELFNSTAAPVDIGGWSLQYGSSTGSSFGSSTFNYVFIPAGATIPALGYYLIRGACTTAGADLPLTADLVASGPNFPPGGFNASGTSGKFALFNDQVTGRTPAQVMVLPTPAFLMDLVGYGPSANAYETAPAPAGTTTTVLVRKLGGRQDTNNNSADFTGETQPYAMHNASSLANVPSMSQWGMLILASMLVVTGVFYVWRRRTALA